MVAKAIQFSNVTPEHHHIVPHHIRVSNLWTIINQDERRRRKFLGGSGGKLLQNILKIGSLKTPFSAHSGRSMWQNGTENCSFTPCSFHYLSQNNSKYPIQAIFLAYDFSAAPLLLKIETFCVPIEVESGFIFGKVAKF